MPGDRILLLVNSVYQLLTAVHMRAGILKEGHADLILTDVTPRLSDYVQNIRQTGLFDRVLFGRTRELNGKYLVGEEREITEGYQKKEELLRWSLSDGLGSYSQIYFSNFDTFTRMLACRYFEESCEFICYEDGFSTYVIDFLREDRAPVNRHPEGSRIREKVRKVLLYEPGLAMRGDGLANLRLPKLNRENEEEKELLNRVFSYKKQEEHTGVLFLEQSFRAEGIRTNELELMRECRRAAGEGGFLVKPHPRNRDNLPMQLGLTGRYRGDAPWELYLLNENPKDLTLATVCSNGALTGRLLFDLDIPTVMLYRLFEGKVLWKEDEILMRYLRKFGDMFAGDHYYVPETVYELENTIQYLGGRYE